MRHVSLPTRCFRAGLPLVVAAAMLAACQARPVATLGVTGGSAAFEGPVGQAEVRIVLADDKARQALGPNRRVQSVDLARATNVDVYATGAGINGWSTVKTNAAFGTADATTGLRTAAFSGAVQAGLRRIIRVVVQDASSNNLEELWGVADITANATTTVTVSRASTPVGQIFRKLVLAGDTAKALTLNVGQVQGFVDKLLNTNSATGAAIDGTKPQINYTLLNTDLAASAIALGEAGVPYKVPAALPAFLTPTPVKKGQVSIEAIDVLGRPVTAEGVGFLDDQASPIMRSASGNPLSLTFPDVTPGTWNATLVDTASGRAVTKAVTVGDQQSKALTVMLPPQDFERVIGAYNLDTNAVSGYNGEFNPPTLASLNNPCNLHARNNVITWADVTNQRIRQVDLGSNTPIVKTIAGNGATATAAAANGTNATEVPLKLDDSATVTLDGNGHVLFSEGGFGRVVRVDKTTGQLTEVLNATQLGAAGFTTTTGIGTIQYVPATDTLYLTNSYNWRNFNNNAIMAVKLGTFPAAGSVTRAMASTKGGFVVSGDYLFYSTGSLDSVIIRRKLSDGTSVNITGKNKLFNNVDGIPAQDWYLNEQSTNRIAHPDMAIDALGNLFVTADSTELYRITDVLNGADGANNWLVHCLHTYTSAAWSRGVCVDEVTGKIYTTGSTPVADPNGTGTQSVHSIKLLRP